ncbi:MAG: hypothetical protein K0S34_1930 [Bacillales bacterium]|jgi:TrpR-related protein YerC/YecD|nr:hypothetical protein [Bacillales bacterium]
MDIESIRKRELSQLFEGVMNIGSVEGIQTLFEDLCTKNELNSFAQRFSVAKMLKAGYTYQKIENETGASTATISRVKRALTDGNNALNKLIESMNSTQKSAL